jgi:tRNA(Ile)-lysidine synthase
MNPWNDFEARLAADWPPEAWRDVTVLVAVSGGADSVALLRGLLAVRQPGVGQLLVGHVNHGLRGAPSEADAEFVAQLCQRLNTPCQIERVGTPLAQQAGDGIEAAAREARYGLLQRMAESQGARYVATAHTKDDQAETILHHVMRGTGLRGLAGMPRARALGPAVSLVRPLLNFSRAEVLAFLASLDQPFREDATNRDVALTRNRVRHELLPLIKSQYSPAIVEALLRLGQLAADAVATVDESAEQLLERSLIESSDARVVIRCAYLKEQQRHLVREVFVALWRRQGWPAQSMGFGEWDALAEMALASSASEATRRKRVLPGAIAAERHGEQLVIEGN